MDRDLGIDRGASLLERLENMPVSRFLIKTRIIVGVATFFDAFDALAIAYVLPVLVGLWKLTPVEIGFMISIGFVGQFVGAILFGWLAERCGRLRVATWTVAIFALASFACALAPSYSVLLVLRFIQGIGLGGEVPIAAAYINEFSRAKGRGRFFMVYELVFPLGLLAAALIGMWAVPNLGWQSMFIIGGAPAVLVLFMRKVLPESPRWLIAVGRLDEAQQVVEKLERYAGSSYSDAKRTSSGATSAATPVKQEQGRWKDLFSGRYLKRTLVLWCLWISAYFIVYGLTAWLPTVYRTVFKLPLDVSLQYALITTACGFVGNVACAFLIDRTGRKTWFVASFLLGGVALGALYFLGAASPMHVVVLSSVSYVFISSIALSLYLYTPELYPTRVRALGVGAASSWLRVASAVGPTFVGAIIAGGKLAPVFGVFALLALFGAVVMVLFSEETTDRQLEEISP
jgi:putative MFS transporter